MTKRLLLLLLLALPTWADQGMTSATHTSNVGRVVFSTEEIKFKNEDPSKLRSTFKLGEPIYGRMYFARSMANTELYHDQLGEPLPPGSGREGNWEVKLSVDGENQNVRFGAFTEGKVSEKAESEWTTWQFNLAPDVDSLKESRITDPWIKVAAGLPPGTHEIKVEFYATLGQYRSKPMAAGSFQLEVGEGASFAAGEFPQSTYTGTDLQSLKEQMKNALDGPVAKDGDEILDVSVTSDWNPGRYTDTLVEYRKIQGTVLWADNNGDGVCRYTSYWFIQDKSGNGWGPLKFKAFSNGGPEGNYKPK
ncbi:MAG: hypothetical protein KC800_20270 [Candidatus Eremiobacteraeota bacterium]|nr:hypothetical protein [Candidatus Eremiobacteraeota bacterium]